MAARAVADLLRAAWSEYERDYARYFATAMVYYALVSLVPLLLLLLSLLGLFLRLSDVAVTTESQVLEAVQTRFGDELRVGLEGMLDGLRRQSIVGTGVSVVGLVLTSSALFRQLRMAFRAIWKHAPPLLSGSLRAVVQTALFERAVAFGMVLLGGVVLVAALALVAVLQWLGTRARDSDVGVAAWLLALTSPLVLGPVTFALLFKFLPPVTVAWRDVCLAAALCTAALFVVTEILALSATALGSGFGALGALGAVLAVMLWMNASSKVLFFGAELCKVASERSAALAGHGAATIEQWRDDATGRNPSF